jgi:hypothetical protein
MSNRGEAYGWETTEIPCPGEIRHDTTGARFREFLSTAPGPGSGHGNTWLFRAALRAKGADISAEEAQGDIQNAMPHKPHGEVTRAVRNAYRLTNDFTYNPVPRTPPRPKADTGPFWTAARRWIGDDPICHLWERSPIRPLDDPERDTVLFLQTMYSPDDLVFIGGTFDYAVRGRTLRTAGEWIDVLQSGHIPAMFICANPLTGEMAPTKDGKESRRCDAAIQYHRFAIVEFDGLPKQDQACFFLESGLPVAAIVDTGGKSLHGWIRVDCEDSTEWIRDVHRVFADVLKPLGADPACRNAARLVRLPGAMRDNGKQQRLLYLAPEGRRIAS